MSRIKDVKTEGGYCSLVELDNGSSVLLNLENRLQTARFDCLRTLRFLKPHLQTEILSVGVIK